MDRHAHTLSITHAHTHTDQAQGPLDMTALTISYRLAYTQLWTDTWTINILISSQNTVACMAVMHADLMF